MMKWIKNIYFFFSIGLVLVGFVIDIVDPYNYYDCRLFLPIALFFLFFFLTAKAVKDAFSRELRTWNKLFLSTMMVLMTVILFFKYGKLDYGDYAGLFIIPLFYLAVYFEWSASRKMNFKHVVVIITFFILSIPVFGINYYQGPITYIPRYWLNRFLVEGGEEVTLPYTFSNSDAAKLSLHGDTLRNSENCEAAVNYYNAAKKLEPGNPGIYFNLSECYSSMNALELAVSELDTAIMLDDQYSASYNNRGLLYSKLGQNEKAMADYKMAISLDSTHYPPYYNLAIAYYRNEQYDSACSALNMAERIGYKDKTTYYYHMIRKHCR